MAFSVKYGFVPGTLFDLHGAWSCVSEEICITCKIYMYGLMSFQTFSRTDREHN